MADNSVNSRKPVTPNAIRSRKNGSAPVTMVSAYDYPFARFADEAGIDIIFVSDALASVGLGRSGTQSVTVDEMVYHTKAVRAGAGNSMVLASLPHLSYTTPREAIANASRLIKEGGACAVEIEGCADLAPTVHALTDAGIAVMAHVGLTKKIAGRTGSYRTQGLDADSALTVIEDALALSEAGPFALLLECVPDRIAAVVTQLVPQPTIGIGAGPWCDGQGLVSQDMLGLFDKFLPRFVQQFAQLGLAATDAFMAFKDHVAQRQFPGTAHTTAVADEVLLEMLQRLRHRDVNVSNG
ncbi:3-methyl-2-oxobutanoate hydroxymethyltransferase [Lacisediminimonas sp.]|uniref:3-methyl-2-oxobutanoate hydroxymethyltransferase n=1 Tax=Lacisediminimonas sp. TaxID=3060582 RepID=UPI00271D7AFE|nr:3-methyl-2-oxobutanoate hydroxymethyltransferase [Lacisediminimonas sp.]MDO8298740.1 3-methyl-2-oxobutanoate hydroxymethyltransferase [Lacisediminimonas sp.]MDO9215776.1 3-methyl-2-oxobutanoate hydroxymethyltransferase [Lacisediminimonas sp.]